MKRRFTYLLLLCGIIALASCRKSDDFTEITVFDAPDLQGNTPVKLKVKQMYDTYNVLFKPEFELAEYTWDWNAKIQQTEANQAGLRYTPAKEAYVIPVVDSIERWVFKVFPLEFSKKYMPLNILLTDTMENKYSGTPLVHRIYEGNIAINYILVSYVSERFEAQKTKRLLRESWLSLFVEKMLIRFPVPTDFATISTAGYAKWGFSNAEDVMTNYALLKKGRTKNGASATSNWSNVTIGQDFGDFVAFIVYTPEAEKQLAYVKNKDIIRKVNLVKTYFKENFDIELPYIPIAN